MHLQYYYFLFVCQIILDKKTIRSKLCIIHYFLRWKKGPFKKELVLFQLDTNVYYCSQKNPRRDIARKLAESNSRPLTIGKVIFNIILPLIVTLIVFITMIQTLQNTVTFANVNNTKLRRIVDNACALYRVMYFFQLWYTCVYLHLEFC